MKKLLIKWLFKNKFRYDFTFTDKTGPKSVTFFSPFEINEKDQIEVAETISWTLSKYAKMEESIESYGARLWKKTLAMNQDVVVEEVPVKHEFTEFPATVNIVEKMEREALGYDDPTPEERDNELISRLEEEVDDTPHQMEDLKDIHSRFFGKLKDHKSKSPK